MKKIIYILLFLPMLGKAQSKIGISNPSPSEKLHIDSGSVKIGKLVWSNIQNNWLKFGDGDFIQIGEQGDDSLYIKSKYIRMEHYSSSNLPTTILLKGNLILDNGTQASGRVLTSSGNNGASTWKSLPSSNSGFHCIGTGLNHLINNTTTPYLLPFSDELYDPGNHFDNSNNNYKYIAAEDGFYHFDVNISLSLPGNVPTYLLSSNLIKVDVLGNSFIVNTNQQNIPSTPIGGAYSMPMSISIYLNAGESVYTDINTTTVNSIFLNMSTSNFSGFRIY
jgi:hypothetical protein